MCVACMLVISTQVKQYSGMADCMRQIIKQDGVTGMWRGSGPTIGRATVLAAVLLSPNNDLVFCMAMALVAHCQSHG